MGRFRIAVIIICIIAAAARLYKIDGPIADWHSWRQSDTAAVARNFLTISFDPFRPRYDDFSNIQTGKDNEEGWRMVEFPLYQIIGASVARLVPSISIEMALRLVSIASSVGSLLFIIYLVEIFADRRTALLSGITFAVLPYAVYYGRTILPEPTAVFLALASSAAIVKYSSVRFAGKDTWIKNGFWLLLGSVCAALAILTKPSAGFLLIGVAYILVHKQLFSARSFLSLAIYSSITIVPFLLWRRWIGQFPEGIPAYEWLFNGNDIRFKGAWFYWLFAERLGKLLLGFWGVVPFALGVFLTPTKREGLLFYSFGVGVLSYFVIFATGNVQHDYYQIIALPAVAIFVGKGLRFLMGDSRFSLLGRLIGVSAIVIASLSFSWYTIRTYYWINRQEIIEAGKAADSLLPANAKVIAPYNGDTTFLYQTKRRGWPIGFDMDKKIQLGATHYVTVSPTDEDLETRDLARDYTVLVRNEKYAIIDLTRPSNK